MSKQSKRRIKTKVKSRLLKQKKRLHKNPKSLSDGITKKKPAKRSDSKKHVESIVDKSQKSAQPIVRPVAKGLSIIDKCKLQMAASILRMTDEMLYNNEAKEANMDEEKFISYHTAYENVASKWPMKPMDFILKYLQKKSFGKLNRLTFADVGCGRMPLLKLGLPQGTVVHSFDLVSTHEHVTKANMESLPLDSETIDCCIYSLSLMAKSLGNVLLEAKRVLKMNGSLLIVEVTSRFEGKEKRWTTQLLQIGFKQRFTETLPPNGYFTFFHFVKTDSTLDYRAHDMKIRLKSCQYKAR